MLQYSSLLYHASYLNGSPGLLGAGVLESGYDFEMLITCYVSELSPRLPDVSLEP